MSIIQIEYIPLSKLVVGADNVRKGVKPENLNIPALAASIKAEGLIHPLTVKAKGDIF